MWQGVFEEVALLEEIKEACRGCVRAFVQDRTDSKGRVSIDSFANFARQIGLQQDPWVSVLKVRPPLPFVKICVSTCAEFRPSNRAAAGRTPAFACSGPLSHLSKHILHDIYSTYTT